MLYACALTHQSVLLYATVPLSSPAEEAVIAGSWMMVMLRLVAGEGEGTKTDTVGEDLVGAVEDVVSPAP